MVFAHCGIRGPGIPSSKHLSWWHGIWRMIIAASPQAKCLFRSACCFLFLLFAASASNTPCALPITIGNATHCALSTLVNPQGVPIRSYAFVSAFCIDQKLSSHECFRIFKHAEFMRTSLEYSAFETLLLAEVKAVECTRDSTGGSSNQSSLIFPVRCDKFLETTIMTTCRLQSWDTKSIFCALLMRSAKRTCVSLMRMASNDGLHFLRVRMLYKIHMSLFGSEHHEVDFVRPSHVVVAGLCRDSRLHAITNSTKQTCHVAALEYINQLRVAFSNTDAHLSNHCVDSSLLKFSRAIHLFHFDGKPPPNGRNGWKVFHWSRNYDLFKSSDVGQSLPDMDFFLETITAARKWRIYEYTLLSIVAFIHGGITFFGPNASQFFNDADFFEAEVIKDERKNNVVGEPIVCGFPHGQTTESSDLPVACLSKPRQPIWLVMIRSIVLHSSVVDKEEHTIIQRINKDLIALLHARVPLPSIHGVKLIPYEPQYDHPQRRMLLILTDQLGASQLQLLLRSMDVYVDSWRRLITTVVVLFDQEEGLQPVDENAFDIVRLNFPHVRLSFQTSENLAFYISLAPQIDRSVHVLPGKSVFVKHLNHLLYLNATETSLVYDARKGYKNMVENLRELLAASKTLRSLFDMKYLISTDFVSENRAMRTLNEHLVRGRQLQQRVTDTSGKLSLQFEPLECTLCFMNTRLFPNLSRLRKGLLIGNANEQMTVGAYEPYFLNLVDIAWSPTSMKKYGCLNINSWRCPTKVQYVFRERPWSGVTIFTPETFIFDYVVEQFERAQGSARVAWFIEPRSIGESPYYSKMRGNEYANITEVENLFDTILTHDDALLERGLPYTRVLFAGMWIGGTRGVNVALQMAQKKHLVSLISSTKSHCPLHRQRLLAAYYFRNRTKYNVHVYGIDHLVPAKQALEAYKFTIVFENDRQNGYFTEKLLNAFGALTIPIYIGGDKNAGKLDFPFPYFSRYGILVSDGSLENLTKTVESLSDPLYERLLKHGGLENRWRARRFRSRDDIMGWKLRTLVQPVFRVRWQLINELAARNEYVDMADICIGCDRERWSLMRDHVYDQEIDSRIHVQKVEEFESMKSLGQVDLVFIRNTNASLRELRTLVHDALQSLREFGMLILEGTDRFDQCSACQLVLELLCLSFPSPHSHDLASLSQIGDGLPLSINSVAGSRRGHDGLEDGFTVIQFGYATLQSWDGTNMSALCDGVARQNIRLARRKHGELMTLLRFHEVFLF